VQKPGSSSTGCRQAGFSHKYLHLKLAASSSPGAAKETAGIGLTKSQRPSVATKMTDWQRLIEY